MGCFNSKVAKEIVVVSKELTQQGPNDPVTTHVHNTANTRGDPSTERAISMPLLSIGQIGEFVELALESYLPEYDFREAGGLIERDVVSIMQVAKEVRISLNPSPAGTKLSYGLFPTKFDLIHSGIKPPMSLKFVYQWTILGRTYITSPNFTPTTIDGTTVPCAKPRDITDHLTESDPVAGIIHELERLYSVDTNSSDNSLAGSDFEWFFHGAYPIAFNVMSRTNLYWEDVNGSSGEVKFTKNEAIGVLLKLTRTQ